MMEGTISFGAALIPVVVKRIARAAAGVITIDLARADGGYFGEWSPGAHIDVLIGDSLERQYSLCGDRDDRSVLRIAVLRETESRGGSKALHERLQTGDVLSIRGPRNNFALIEANEYVLIAGGIGVTPILPMVADLQRRGKRWSLLYGGRTRASMAFLDLLAAYGDNVRVQPEDEGGLLDIAGHVGAPRAGCAIYCCGPEKLIAAVERQCAGWPPGAVRFERFRPPDGAFDSENAAFEVELARQGLIVRVAADQSIAEAVEKAGFYIPRSCNEGTCGTCITKLIDGVPDHRDSFLRGRMRTENKRIMVCCSRAKSERLVLDI